MTDGREYFDQIDEFGVAIESQRFQVAAAVSERVQIGLAEEYVISLVATLESIELKDLRRFFDFPDDDTVMLVEWLIGEEYLEVQDARLRLGRKGLSVLRDTDEHGLRAIASRVVTEPITLELIGGSIVNQLQSNVGNHVPVVRGNSGQDLRALVEQTVARHFREWTSGWTKRDGDGGDDLYRVVDVEPQTRFRSVQPVFVSVAKNGNRVTADLDFSNLSRRGLSGSRDLVIAAMRQQILTTIFPDDALDALSFLSGFDNGALSRHRRLGKMDLKRWILEPPADRVDGASFTGSLVSPIGIKIMSTILPLPKVAQDGESIVIEPPILWIRPSNVFWGTASGFAGVVAHVTKSAGARGIVLITRETDLSIPKGKGLPRGLISATGLFRDALILPDDCFPGTLELIVDPGRWFFAIVYQPCPPDGLPVPVAHFSINAKASKDAASAVLQRLKSIRTPVRELALTPGTQTILQRLSNSA